MKILLIQLRRLGDILLTTPSIALLKASLPEAEIDFLAEPVGEAVLQGNPHLNEILFYSKKKSVKSIKDVRAKQYDTVIDFMGNPRTAILTGWSGATHKVGFRHRGRFFFYTTRVPIPRDPEYVALRKTRLVHAFLDKIGAAAKAPPSLTPELFLNNEDKQFVDRWCKEEKHPHAPYAILAPAHRHPIRQWLPDRFRQTGLSLVRDKGIRIYIAWGPEEKNLAMAIRKGHEKELGILPPTSFRQMAAVFSKAKFVVTNDSGSMHLSVAVKTPTVTIYGPTRPVDWNPSVAGLNGTVHAVVTAADVACLGCHLARCPVGHLCMTHVSTEEVLDACEPFLTKEE